MVVADCVTLVSVLESAGNVTVFVFIFVTWPLASRVMESTTVNVPPCAGDAVDVVSVDFVIVGCDDAIDIFALVASAVTVTFEPATISSDLADDAFAVNVVTAVPAPFNVNAASFTVGTEGISLVSANVPALSGNVRVLAAVGAPCIV